MSAGIRPKVVSYKRGDQKKKVCQGGNHYESPADLVLWRRGVRSFVPGGAGSGVEVCEELSSGDICERADGGCVTSALQTGH
jgi:hypothetical protein